MAGDRLLVTGATGFVGLWVLRHWRATHPEVEVWATSERPRPAEIPESTYRRVDLLDADAVGRLVRAVQPTAVIHLAGRIGHAALAELLAVNVVGTENLYAALAQGADESLRIIQASSSAIYGPVSEEELPITEDQPLRPVSPYAISKAAQDMLAEATFRTRGLGIIRARPFNMLGPGQPASLVPMTFIEQLASVRAGRADSLTVGNTSPRRDFVDVRDVVAAFDLLLEKGRPGRAYNVGTGRDASIQELIDALLELTGLDVPVAVDADRVRAVDVPRVCADVSRLVEETGFRPTVPLSRSLEAMWAEAIE